MAKTFLVWVTIAGGIGPAVTMLKVYLVVRL